MCLLLDVPRRTSTVMAQKSNQIAPELLEILICPLTRSKLRQEGDELVAEVGALRYPVRDGIPVLLIEEAILPEGILSLDQFKQKFRAHIPEDL